MHSRLLALPSALLFSALVSGCGSVQSVSAAQVAQQGPAGPQGPPGLVYMGAYDPKLAYVPTDVVYYLGSSYVNKVGATGVSPVGNPASAMDWGPLADKGDVGAMGAKGDQGIPGIQGAPGVPGVKGDAGATGPSGPTGQTGAAGANGKDYVPFLHGKQLGVNGDSFSANSEWQHVVESRTGATVAVQDARAGRSLITAFECYQTTTPGSTLGTFQPVSGSNVCTGSGTFGNTVGNTLAQNLANVDLQILDLGTNDQNEPLGQIGDATNAGTFYGNLRWVVEAYLTAKPGMRLVLVTVQYNGLATVAVNKQFADATVAYGESIGVPVINMFKLGGVNALTASTLLRDGTHPSAYGFSNFYGPVITQQLQTLF